MEDELRETLKVHPQIDAIFAVNEIYAAAAMRVIRELKMTVPDDISLVCLTDGVISKYATPPLTTVNQHGTQIGIEAANLLIDRLESEESEVQPITKVIACEIVKRHST